MGGFGGGSLEHPRQWLGAQWMGLSPWASRAARSRTNRGSPVEAQEPSRGAAKVAHFGHAAPQLCPREEEALCWREAVDEPRRLLAALAARLEQRLVCELEAAQVRDVLAARELAVKRLAVHLHLACLRHLVRVRVRVRGRCRVRARARARVGVTTRYHTWTATRRSYSSASAVSHQSLRLPL
eukprot:scaffold103143_cov42-Phaeocystis_antarctica.AAC.2